VKTVYWVVGGAVAAGGAYLLLRQGQSVPGAPGATCPSGTTWDPSRSACVSPQGQAVAPTCPAGMFWDITSNKCLTMYTPTLPQSQATPTPASSGTPFVASQPFKRQVSGLTTVQATNPLARLGFKLQPSALATVQASGNPSFDPDGVAIGTGWPAGLLVQGYDGLWRPIYMVRGMPHDWNDEGEAAEDMPGQPFDFMNVIDDDVANQYGYGPSTPWQNYGTAPYDWPQMYVDTVHAMLDWSDDDQSSAAWMGWMQWQDLAPGSDAWGWIGPAPNGGATPPSGDASDPLATAAVTAGAAIAAGAAESAGTTVATGFLTALASLV
jgi:hypothetical protein